MGWTAVTNTRGMGPTPRYVGPMWTPSAYVAGNYYYCNAPAAAPTPFTTVNNTCLVSPWVVTASITVTRLFFQFTVAGEANSYVRLGIWNDTGSNKPGTLVLDAGTISTGTGNAGTVATGGTPGVKEVTVSQALTPGLYWVGGAVQNSPTTAPTLYLAVAAGSQHWNQPMGTTLPGANVTSWGWSQTGVSGAFGTFTATPTLSSFPPRIGFKVT